MSDKLFDNPYYDYTVIRNEVFDGVMPMLSSDEWKVFCVALRQELSAASPGDAAGLSLADFIARSGIKELDVVQKALMACVSAEFLRLVDDEETTEALYALNDELVVARLVEESEAEAEEETIPIPTAIPPEKARAYRDLMAFGEAMAAEPKSTVVEQAVLINDLVMVLAWIRLGEEMEHLAQVDRFQAVMDRLMAQVPPVPEAIAEIEAELEAEALESQEVAGQEEKEAGEALDLASPEGLWQATLTILETKMRSSLFKWVKGTVPVSLEGGVLTVAAPNKRTCDWLETGKMASTIKKSFASVAGDVALKFVVEA